MENLFKSTSCEDESQNPLMNMLSHVMQSDPSQHLRPFGAETDAFNDMWEEAEIHHEQPNWPIEAPPVDHEALWQESENLHFDQIWDRELENVDQQDLVQEYDNYIQDSSDFVKQWNKAARDEYKFTEDNQYREVEGCFELAKVKEAAGETNEAILLLEAEVQRNPEHSEAWGLLGKLHAKNDQDTRAIGAMLRGLEVDPYNLDLLMSLGISCTNELDEDQALGYLKTWIQHHPLYSDIPVDSGNLKDDIFEAFKVAVSMNSNDPDVFQALGVLSFLNGDFELAEVNFRNALMMKQEDAALWNRLGAALAKQEKTEAAFECYHKALEIKPDFVRTWGNLGLAYGNRRDYENSARFYLCALSLNPQATHIYHHLTTAFIMMNRFDLFEKLALKDPRVFADEFQIITRESLPKSSQWVNEFN